MLIDKPPRPRGVNVGAFAACVDNPPACFFGADVGAVVAGVNVGESTFSDFFDLSGLILSAIVPVLTFVCR